VQRTIENSALRRGRRAASIKFPMRHSMTERGGTAAAADWPIPQHEIAGATLASSSGNVGLCMSCLITSSCKQVLREEPSFAVNITYIAQGFLFEKN